jgi:hypothetical protein
MTLMAKTNNGRMLTKSLVINNAFLAIIRLKNAVRPTCTPATRRSRHRPNGRQSPSAATWAKDRTPASADALDEVVSRGTTTDADADFQHRRTCR